MLVVSLLEKYKKYLKRSFWILGFLQTSELFSLLFLLIILFDGYKLTFYFPWLNTFAKTQTYTGTYWFNIYLMAAEAVLLTPVVSIIYRLASKKRKEDLVNRLERNFPELRTKLSTAYDNRQNFNIVTKKLFEDVHKQLTEVNIKKLTPYNQMFRSLMIFLIASGVILFCMHEGFSFDISPGKLMDDILDNLRDLPGKTVYDEEDETKNTPDDKYEVEAVIIKNGEQVEMEINPSLGLGFTNQVEGDTDNEFNGSSNNFSENFRYSQTYTENLPEEYEPLIKEYFEELSS